MKEESKTKLRIRNRGNTYHLGYKHSEETKKKIREARRGQKFTEETRQKMRISRARRIYTSEMRKNISLALKGKKHKPNQGFQQGIGNSNWRGGITPEIVNLRKGQENRLWRESVYSRDDWTCQKCWDSKGGNLNSHHVQNFIDCPELRFAVCNGITFCETCHIKFHKKYGYKKNTEEQLFIFLKND